MQAIGAEIRSDHRHERHERCVLNKKVIFFVGDQERRSVAQHAAGNDPEGGLPEQVEQSLPDRKVPGAMAMPRTAKVTMAPMASLNAGLAHHGLGHPVLDSTCLKMGTSVAGPWRRWPRRAASPR